MLCHRYDPNYADDMDEDGGSDGGSDAGDTDDDVSEEDYSDDDDMSWKVRRCEQLGFVPLYYT